MSIDKVALIGANGNLGPSVLTALVASFAVTVLSRASSKSTYASGAKVVTISDDPTSDELAQALTGQDALVTTFGGTNADLQIKLADAAVKAGVKRFIPADFGSCDSSSQLALDLMPLYRAKTRVREYLQQVAKSHPSFSWTSLVCGHFFDYGLKTGLLSCDVKAKKMTIFDDGEYRWSATTLETVGKAVVRVLQRLDETRDRMIYIQSFSMTQNELLKALQSATSAKWEVEKVESQAFIKENKPKADANPDDDEARENLVSVVGIIDGDWTKKDNFANQILGLENEDLQQVVNRVLDSR